MTNTATHSTSTAGETPGQGANLSATARIVSVQDDLVTIDPEMLTLDALELMRAHRVGCLPVLKDKRLVGVVTERNQHGAEQGVALGQSVREVPGPRELHQGLAPTEGRPIAAGTGLDLHRAGEHAGSNMGVAVGIE